VPKSSDRSNIIGDIVAGRFGLKNQQGRGSHVKLCHPATRTIVVVPSRRPIKEVYVRLLIKLINKIPRTP